MLCRTVARGAPAVVFAFVLMQAPPVMLSLTTGMETATVLLVSATLIDAPLMRLTVEPTPENGLRKSSQVMLDKAMTVRRDKLGAPFGRLDDDTMVAVNRGLALFLGLA